MSLLRRFTLIIGVVLLIVLFVNDTLSNRLLDIYGNHRLKLHTRTCCRTRRRRKLGTKLFNRSCSVLRKNLESVDKSVYYISRKLLGKLAGNHKSVVCYTLRCVNRVCSDERSVKNGTETVNIRPCALTSLKAVLFKSGIAVIKLAFKLASGRSDLADAEACYPDFTV